MNLHRLAPTLALVALLAGCGGDSAPPPDGDAATRVQVPQWPVLFSHAWSRTADTAFQGDQKQAGAEFDRYGVKRDLESLGLVVYQPDKLAYASHERRGQLLYKKCAGRTMTDILCQGADPQPVDGVHLATLDYCADPSRWKRHGFSDETLCRAGLKFNLICHSQGCPDSRYMMAAVRNEFSGELMYRHIASWTSMAGANKGTAQADWVLERLAACLTPGCRSLLLDAFFAVDSFSKNQALITEGGESVVALSRKYMLVTTDMDCRPAAGRECPPSFNQRYPLPEDPAHPVYYQSFSSQIHDIAHPCYAGNRLFWQVVLEREGPNDGNISVESQQFTSYGPEGSGGATPVIARWIDGQTRDPSRPHPGLNHMAYNDSEVPGIPGVSCRGEDNSAFHFSRLELYRGIVSELAAMGY